MTDTANKASEKTGSAVQNAGDTAQHYADKTSDQSTGTSAGDTANKAQAQAGSVLQNAGETAQHYANKATEEANKTGPDGQKSYVQQAQDAVVGGLNYASQAATSTYRAVQKWIHANVLVDAANAISGEKK